MGVGGCGGEGDGGGIAPAPDIMFLAANDDVSGYELWKTDGTTAGTVMVKNITTIAGVGSSPFGFTVFNSALYFQANDGATGSELWKTDGTGDGTARMKDLCPGNYNGIVGT